MTQTPASTTTIRRTLPTSATPPPLPGKAAPSQGSPRPFALSLPVMPVKAEEVARAAPSQGNPKPFALSFLTVAQSKTVLPVPAHKHDENFCEFCREAQYRETVLKFAVSLAYMTNCVGDAHTTLVGTGNSMAHDIARLAWEALGQPGRVDTEAICQGSAGWDGCDNSGMQDWFREQDAAAEEAARIAARPGEIASHLCRNVQDEPVDLHLVMLRAMAMRGDLKNESPYGEETTNEDMVAGLRLAISYLDPVTGHVNRDLM